MLPSLISEIKWAASELITLEAVTTIALVSISLSSSHSSPYLNSIITGATLLPNSPATINVT